MLDARLRIKYPGYKENISVKHILSCSVTNQGCDGGYSYLVGKFGSEIELIPKSCEKNSGKIFYKRQKPSKSKVKCQKICSDPKLQNQKIKVKDYQFIGGSYGRSSEEAMMREIYKNGPVVCSFDPGYSFNWYKGGVYTNISYKNWKQSGLSKPQWIKVGHSVVCYGWGKFE